MDALDAQGEQYGIGVGGIDGDSDGRAFLGVEADVATNQVDLVADPVKQQDPLVAEVEGMATHADALGDGNGAEEGPLELMRLDLGVEAIVLAVEFEQTFGELGSPDEFLEVLEFLLGLIRIE